MNTDARTELFERAPVRTAVIRQTVPAVLSQMILLVYSLADTWFVGLLNDPKQTAAVAVCAAPFMLLTVFSNLFGVGGGSAVSRALGRKDFERTKEISGIAFWLASLSAACYALFFTLLREPILRLGGATDDTVAACEGYALWVISVGGIFSVLNQTLANLIRSEGSARLASLSTSFGGILNILLDPLFVLPQFLGMGAAGAGLATALSNMASALIMGTAILCSKNTVLSLSPRSLRHIREQAGEILTVGFPSALQIGLTSVAVSAQAAFVARYSTEAVAALGIVKKLDQLPLYFSIGVANGLMPLLAYNHASGNNKRRSEAFRFAAAVSVGFALICLVVYEAFAPVLAGFFIRDAQTVSYAAAFLRRMVVAMPFMAFCYPMIIQFQAMKEIRASLVCSILRKGVLDIPFLFLWDRFLPLYGCMWVQPTVDFISLFVAVCFYRSIAARQREIEKM